MRTPPTRPRPRSFSLLLVLAVLAAGLITPPASAGPRYAGYVFFYFTGEGTATGEQVYLAASRGNDPLRWDELNGGRPVLTSSLGDRGVIGSGHVSRGEGPTVFKSNTEDRWYLFIDEFGGRGYVPFESTDLASGDWRPSADHELPASPRHGTVLPVTRSELDGVRAAFP